VKRLTRFWLYCTTLGFMVAVICALILAAVIDGWI
jgi:hypothetical protein